MRERERLLGAQLAGRGEVGAKLAKSKVESEGGDEGKEGEGEENKGEWVDEGEERPRGTQRVYVLERGFEGWQEAFGRDTRLTENWSAELWGAE